MFTASVDVSAEPNQDLVHIPTPPQRGSDLHERGVKEAAFRSVLTRLGRSELRRVNVSLFNGALRLQGDVSSYHAKQLAQEALRPTARGLRIENHLRVIGRK